MDKYYILSSHFESTEEVLSLSNISIVGGKALGLFNLKKEETLPFIVIKSDLYSIWCSDRDEAQSILLSATKKILELFKLLDVNSFIVRSSAKIESYRERGKYFSSDGNISEKYLYDTIIDVWDKNNNICEEFEGNSFAVIIQQFISSESIGHLSNERRVSRNMSDWLIEYYDKAGRLQKSYRVRSKKEKTIHFNLKCTNKIELESVLKSLASHIASKKQRCHIEWVWDKKQLWIVQCDNDEIVNENTEPGAEWKNSQIKSTKLDFNVLKKLSLTKDCKWNKTKCVQKFIDLDLPFGEIYILEDIAILERLNLGEISNDLKDELCKLLEYPIVIRTDITSTSGFDGILLPRTDSIFALDATIEYLKKQVEYFLSKDIKLGDFCFLMHRFILSQSCALAFSRPNISKTRIDSTWGIVDGLYYHSHDSFEVSIKDEKIQKEKKLIRCKDEYLDVKADGTWFSKLSGVKYDWKESLTKKQRLKIAEYTTKIADDLGKSVTVMYFVDIDKCTGYKSILPWFYILDEITENSERFSDSIFSNNYILIETKDDLKKIKQQKRNNNHKYTIKLRPNAEIIRDKEIVEDIAIFSINNNIPVELEGSILAHPYYILRNKGVQVRCLNYFDPKYDSQTFHKLVRDNIPINIESKGERTTTLEIEPKELLFFLKKKAIEEALEFYWESKNDAIIEELADLYEIIRSSCKVFDITIQDIEDLANTKVKNKGGFDSGIFLLDTTESSLIKTIEKKKKQSELLFGEDQIDKKSYQNRIRKAQKIYFDNFALHIPYIGNNIDAIKLPTSIDDSQIVEIHYTNKNIEIHFLKEKHTEDLLQLRIQFPKE